MRRLAWVAGALFAAAAAGAWAAPTAVEVLQKSQAAAKGHKTYQAVMLMDMNGGQMGTMTMKMDLKSIPPNRTRVKMTPVGKPTGAMAMGANMASTEIVDDGTSAFIYFPAMNRYMKQPSGRGTRRLPGSEFSEMQIDQTKTNYKLLAPTTVGGRKVFVVEATPKKAPGPGQPKKATVFVDQSTYRMRQMRIVTGMPNGGDMQIKVTVQSERLNAPIPASTFKFAVPAGATLMQMPTGAPGGAPGGPGGRPSSVR